VLAVTVCAHVFSAAAPLCHTHRRKTHPQAADKGGGGSEGEAMSGSLLLPFPFGPSFVLIFYSSSRDFFFWVFRVVRQWVAFWRPTGLSHIHVFKFP